MARAQKRMEVVQRPNDGPEVPSNVMADAPPLTQDQAHATHATGNVDMSTRAAPAVPVVPEVGLRAGKQITATLLADIFLGSPVPKSEGEIAHLATEATYMSRLAQAYSSSPAEEIRKAIKGLPEQAISRGLSKKTGANYASHAKAIFNAGLMVYGRTWDWLKGLDRIKAYSQAVKACEEEGISPSTGKPLLSKEQRQVVHAEKAEKNLDLMMLENIRKEGKSVFDPHALEEARISASAQLLSDWADEQRDIIVKRCVGATGLFELVRLEAVNTSVERYIRDQHEQA